MLSLLPLNWDFTASISLFISLISRLCNFILKIQKIGNSLEKNKTSSASSFENS
jgi:hypothetical protein